MRVLLDSDVVFDFLLERQPFFQEARQLMLLSANEVFDGFVSSITPINVFYHGRKIIGSPKIRIGLEDLLKIVRVCPITHAGLVQALDLPFSDYEDAVQHASAAENELEAIVTRNLVDYKNATLPVFSPSEFLAKLQSQLK